ncbi:putative ribosome quality control (RQC) complex YloA/Tae2 family protein [Bacillus pakistanensis]|uniref:Rqc2 homolog RqcH n=1 Tax=Rossellomorea pakistanensis TaxID=992288 RepID=A0ABS2NG86_9BACI|nr:NFACT RNA binding domain-containing protein [Bacillus pakistanensis]MBM7586774.1 putative ribosome quality control (RQC) complex YloA/Tae2 family protein [Bacillus pakistanensis]
MSFDGLFTRAMSQELSDSIESGRINKIHQPYKNEIIFIVRANGKNHKLLLSAHPSYSRVQLTEETYENPTVPPMFCMLLRKHLEGYIIESISQVGLDRIIIFDIKGRNEIGDTSYKKLIVEIMGRHSNIILVDTERNMILDSIKHISPSVNSHRTVLPGHEYVMPPYQNKKNPFESTHDDILRSIDFNSGKIDKQIVDSFAGISPLFAKEVVFKAGLANQRSLPSAFLSLVDKVKNKQYEPTFKSGTKETFYLMNLEHLEGSVQTYPSLSQLLDRYFYQKASRDRVKQQGNDLERFIKNERDKNQNKIVKLEQTLDDAKQAERYQLLGELLTSNIYAVKKGMEEIEVINYYDEEGSMIKIPLNPQKTPSENAQNYFSKYQKAKNATVIVHEQIEKAKKEIEYFEQLLQQLESASPKDIEEIREELEEEGYLRVKKTNKKKKTNHKPEVEKYVSSDGTTILVGKNNKQNDYLTNRIANRHDIWLHTKDIPGSHVVIRSENPSETTIKEAANIAAYFSKAKESSSVPVDYTIVKQVKKPKGAKPGFVIYEGQQTIYVTPSLDLVRFLKK